MPKTFRRKAAMDFGAFMNAPRIIPNIMVIKSPPDTSNPYFGDTQDNRRRDSPSTQTMMTSGSPSISTTPQVNSGISVPVTTPATASSSHYYASPSFSASSNSVYASNITGSSHGYYHHQGRVSLHYTLLC
jgi:hypothetical protein